MRNLAKRQADMKRRNAKVKFPFGYCELHRRVHAGPAWYRSKQYCPDCREVAEKLAAEKP